MANRPPPTRPPAKSKVDTLREIGLEVHSPAEQGRPISNQEALYRQMWKLALGYTESVRDEGGYAHEVVHEPNLTISKSLLEQIAGKPGTAQVEEKKGPSAAERVRALAVERVNAIKT
jgi:hypothetical protein